MALMTPDLSPWERLRLESGFRSNRQVAMAAKLPEGTLQSILRQHEPLVPRLISLVDALNAARAERNRTLRPEHQLAELTDREVYFALRNSRRVQRPIRTVGAR